MAGHAGTAGVEVDEVEGEALGVLAGLAGGAAPVGGVEAREPGRAAVGAHVARDAVDLLERHEELVAAGVLEEEVVALLAGHLLAHDVGKEGDAVRGVDHVVAGLEREGDARGVHAAGAAVPRHAGREVAHREHGEAGARHDDARRHRRVGERDAPERQGRRGGGLVGVGVAERHAVLGRGAERLLERHRLVAEVELELLSGRAVGHGEEHRDVIVQQLAHTAEQADVAAGDAGLAHGQLGRDLGARAQHARKREALLGAKVQVARHGEEAVERLAGVSGQLDQVVGRTGAVVEEGARLGEAHERLARDVLERAGGLAEERG